MTRKNAADAAVSVLERLTYVMESTARLFRSRLAAAALPGPGPDRPMLCVDRNVVLCYVVRSLKPVAESGFLRERPGLCTAAWGRPHEKLPGGSNQNVTYRWFGMDPLPFVICYPCRNSKLLPLCMHKGHT